MADHHPTETPALPEQTPVTSGSLRRDRRARTPRFYINVRLLVWSVVAAGVLGVSLFFWYKFQVQRHDTAILARARVLQENENWSEAAAAFHRYLQLRPADAEAQLLLAEAFDKQADRSVQLRRAVNLYFQAVRSNPSRHDARLRLAQLLYDTRRYDEAAEQGRRVLEALPEDVKAARLVAAALREQLGPAKRVTLAEVITAYEEGLSLHKGDIPLSVGLADILRKKYDVLPARRRERAVFTADAVINQMVAANETDAEAFLARFRYRSAHQIEGAAADLEQARQLAPDSVDVLLASARSAAETDHALAQKYGQRLLVVAPTDRRAYLTLATLYKRWKKFDDAIRILRTGLEKIGDSDIELNRPLLQLLLFVGDAEEARVTLGRIEPVARRIGPYLLAPVRSRLGEDIAVAQAQLQILEGNTVLALPELRRMAVNVTEGADPAETLAERERRWRILGGAYSRLGLYDLAGAAYDELVRLDPGSQEFRLLAAAAWRQSGDIERAIRHLDAATRGTSESPAAWIALAEARLDYQLRKVATESRDWKGVDATLKQAQTKYPDVPGVALVQATVAIARNHREAAANELKKLLENKDLDPALLPQIAALLQTAGDKDTADAALARLAEAGADPAVIAFAKSDVLRRRGDPSAAAEALVQVLDKVPETQRDALLRQLISMEIEAGAMRSARHRLRELRKTKTGQLWVYETAADLALLAGENGDVPDLKEIEDEVSRVEGPGGTLGRYVQAARLLASDENPVAAANQANHLVQEIEKTRPGWPQVLVLRGRIAMRQGNLNLAAQKFEQALRAGARGLTVYNWMVSTLYRQERFSDAESYIQQGGQIASLSGDLSSQAVPRNLQRGNIRDALRVAKAAAELRPDDTAAQVWYGQTLSLANRPKDAEDVLRKAIGLKSTSQLQAQNILARTALVWFYSRERRQDDARKALDELVHKVDLTPHEKLLLLARGSNLIGDRQVAAQHYQQALSEKKKDPKLLEEVGKFYFQFDHDKSLELYQQAFEVNPQSVEARRAVALLLGLHGSEADRDKAMALLDEARGSGDKSTSTDDTRLEAALLIARGGADNARKAASLLTELLESGDADDKAPLEKTQSRQDNRLLLARAYEAMDNLAEARAQFETVLKTSETPAVLVLYIEFQMRHELLDEAGKGLARLEEKDPSHARLLGLRVDWLNRSQRAAEIEGVVDTALATRLEAAKTDEAKANLLRYAADLFTRAKLYDAAEKKLREVAALLPAGYEGLAVWLAQRDRFDEAVALCLEKLTGADRARETIPLIRVLTIASARSKAPFAEPPAAEKAIADSLASEKLTLQLVFETAVMRSMQGRDVDAIALYEEALKMEPGAGNIAIRNNLAVLLADVPARTEEALTLINEAVAAIPNSRELEDSKALVLIGAGRHAEARDILVRICLSEKKNPRYRLHLAIALFHLDEPSRAREEAEQAKKDGLESELLTPADRRQFKAIAGDVATAIQK